MPLGLEFTGHLACLSCLLLRFVLPIFLLAADIYDEPYLKPVTPHGVHPKEFLINYPESQPFIWTKNRRCEVNRSVGGVSQLKAWYYRLNESIF
mgnify:CR=1 FL=1